MKKEKKKLKLSDFFKYLKYSYKYSKDGKKYLLIVLLVNILLTIISILLPIFNAKQIVKLTDGAWDDLIFVTLLVFGLEISVNVFRYIFSYGWNNYFYKVKMNIQLELARETLKITTDDLNANSSGVFIERINNDTDNVSNFFVEFFEYFANIISSLGVFISVFFINKVIFCLYFLFILILFLLQKRASGIILAKERIHVKNREKVNGFTSEIVRGSKDIKILNAERSFLEYAALVMNDMKKSGLDTFMTRAKYRFFNGNFRDILNLLINLTGLYFIINGSLSISALLIIHNYSGKIINISRECEGLLESINIFNLAASRIFGILEEDEFHKESFGSTKVNSLEGFIKFDNVCFDYDDSNMVLKNMSFDIKANSTIAFVGKSGAGKSTIFNLISKLYEVNSGNIYLDNYNINDLDRDSIRGNLSIIS